jgi:hypothetical protein
MAGHLLGVLEPSVVLQVNRDASCPPGVTSDGSQKARRLGSFSNWVKFQQRYQKSHRIFRDLLLLKNFWRFCSTRNGDLFSPAILGPQSLSGGYRADGFRRWCGGWRWLALNWAFIDDVEPENERPFFLRSSWLFVTKRNHCPPPFTDSELRAAIFTRISREQLEEDVATIGALSREDHGNYFEHLCNHYGQVRRFLPRLLREIHFEGNRAGQSVLEALEFLKRLEDSPQVAIQDAPREVLSRGWRQ